MLWKKGSGGDPNSLVYQLDQISRDFSEHEQRTEQRIQDLENKLWKLQERLDKAEGIR